MPSAALLAWHHEFGGLPPIGYLLRASTPDSWVRLHSLPGGKRYPTTRDEVSEVLRRQNTVASAVLGLGASVTAWIAHGDGAPPLDMEVWRWAGAPPQWRVDASIAERIEGARLLERTLTWTPGVLDHEIRLCAEDRVASLTLHAAALGSAFCPYDGGMDVILRTPALVEGIRRLFPNWVSTHPAGL